YADLYSEAFPVLQEYSVPATIYLIVHSVQTGEVPWYDRIFVAFQVGSARNLIDQLGLSPATKLKSPKQRLMAAAKYLFTLRALPEAKRRACCDRVEKCVPLPKEALTNRMLQWDQIREMQATGISFGSHSMTHPAFSQLNASDVFAE